MWTRSVIRVAVDDRRPPHHWNARHYYVKPRT